MLVFNLTVVLFLAAYMILKRRHPEKSWLYGQSWLSSYLLILGPALGSVAMTILTIMDDYTEMGIPRINLVSFSVVLVFGFVIHAILLLTRKKMRDANEAHVTETIKLLSQRGDGLL